MSNITPESTPEALQRKLYFLLEQLQEMARELPPKYQMRVPIELLSGLANSLLNDTIFEIVKRLMEIQHVTEEHLLGQRKHLMHNHSMQIEELTKEISSEDSVLNNKKKLNLQEKQKEELKQFDMKLVLELDEKVNDQQSTLEQAGVPGFFVTSKPMEVKLQMYLLDFILRLSKMQVP